MNNFDSLLNEFLGMTNKSPLKVDFEFEQQCLAEPIAPNLTGASKKVLSDTAFFTDVDIPQCVKDALTDCKTFPIDDAYLLWMELKVAEHNGVDPDCICAHYQIQSCGKMWNYIPELATRWTGFTYNPK